MSSLTKTKTAIWPGQVWLDTDGKRIQAHGGSIHYEDGVFYWYGENKEKTTPGSGNWHWGVRAYASADLYNWEDRGLIIPPVLDDPESPLHPAQKMDRPHIIFNQQTGKYVCWVKVMIDLHTQASTVLVADSFLGPYEIVQTNLQPNGMNAGDFDLAVDPDTQKAHYFFGKVHTELICADLSDDYTDVTGNFTSHFPHQGPPLSREAPAHFERNGTHYLITSGTTGYFPNESEIASAPTYHGPWTVLGDPHPSDQTRTSFRSQVTSVFKHPHKEDLYIALADRWLPELAAEDIGAAIEDMHQAFAKLAESPESVDAGELLASDTSISDYVWLPIRFEGDHPVIEWHDEWRIEDF
ncbi:family 43 glycosylhydrolase [Paenarthrobacter sp. YAF11_1]|uniref:family 43 glycosylhydrolase n=1 Tax=Paenarthrobacter sp. YAF11_1 TaxID=3233074 RepID=UPI003F9CECB5